MARKLREWLGIPSLRIIRGEDLHELRRYKKQGLVDLAFLRAMPPEHQPACLAHLDGSKAQLRQDLFALAMTGFKRHGTFVEFGATDGIHLSNSYLLETEFGWTGILAEPGRNWHAALKQNRSAQIETRCVWKNTGDRLTFFETQAGELSTLEGFADQDEHAKNRASRTQYEVETISLTDMLAERGASDVIDLLSIDTEGSEYDILSAFDFDRFKFRVIVCEHNYGPQREEIHSLLTSHGYERRYQDVSAFDDWYVHPAV